MKMWFGANTRKKNPSFLAKIGSPNHLNEGKGHNLLTYQRASQIFEAIDAGFTNEETQMYAHVNEEVFDYAVRNKERLSEKIVGFLRVLYPDKDYETPYLVPEKRVL